MSEAQTENETVTVYRIQPQGAELHGIETESSNGDPAGGVHVFESIAEVVAARGWMREDNVELAEIEVSASDLRRNGDYEGATLKAGRGTIVRTRRFRDTDRVARWAEIQASK